MELVCFKKPSFNHFFLYKFGFMQCPEPYCSSLKLSSGEQNIFNLVAPKFPKLSQVCWNIKVKIIHRRLWICLKFRPSRFGKNQYLVLPEYSWFRTFSQNSESNKQICKASYKGLFLAEFGCTVKNLQKEKKSTFLLSSPS